MPSLASYTTLDTVDVSNNQLDTIDPTQLPASQIVNLYAGYNFITSVDFSAPGWSSLTNL